MPLSPRARARVSALAALAIGASSLAGCAPAVRQTAHPALSDRPFKLERLAVAPFRLGVSASRDAQASGTDPQVAALVASKVSEALTQSGVALVAPEDVGRALEASRSAGEADLPALARVVADRFGANALLVGTVTRYRERTGEAMGTTGAASVGFEVTLVRAPGGEKLWTGVFEETQHAISENVFNVGRYPGGGTHWLSAEELTRWGAGEIAKTIPRGN